MKIWNKNSVVFSALYILGIIVLVFFVYKMQVGQIYNETSTAAEITTIATTSVEPTTETTTIDPIQQQVDAMSLDEKIGQMLFVAYRRNADETPVLYGNDEIKAEIEKYNIGGFILFSENMQSVEQTKQLTAFFKENSRIMPFIGIDEEGGIVSRIGSSGIIEDYNITNAQNMKSSQEVSSNYAEIATTLSELGFNLDFAPVADVNTNADNPVIGVRSFSSDVKTAGEMMLVAAKTLQNKGIVPVIKHFPGHGDTQTDSHNGKTILRHNMERLENVELVPFEMGIENKLPAIMVAHLTTPGISESDLPASLNPEIVKGLLREKMGFDGVVITDAMNMGAITQCYTCEDAVVKAVNADVDIILMPPDIPTAFNAIKTAVENGAISRNEINNSVYRILKLKNTL